MDRAPHVLRYICVLKNMRFTNGMRNMHFTNPWKALYLHIATHALKYFFSKRTFDAHSGKRICYKTPVSGTLPDLCKTCVITYIKRALLNLHVYHALNVRLTRV